MGEQMVSTEVVFERLGHLRSQVHSRLEHLIEEDGRYLNVEHVKFQLEALDIELDVVTMEIGSLSTDAT